MINKKTRIIGTFDKEEYASIVYQIIHDNEHVEYINMLPDQIEYGTLEFNQ